MPNHDSFVKTTLEDKSIVAPAPEVTPVGFSVLMPIFARKGLDNEITRFGGLGSFEHMYGTDLYDVKKWGHAGLVAGHALKGGAILDACRLMPDEATAASAILVVDIRGAGTTRTVKLRVKQFDSTKGDIATMATTDLAAITAADAVPASGNTPAIPAVLAEDAGKSYPIIGFKSVGRGTFGNDIIFSIGLDTERDGKNTDGRRYVLTLSEKNDNGIYVKMGDAYESISFSFNPNSVAIPGSKIPDSFDTVFNAYAKAYKLPVKAYYASENFDEIVSELNTVVGTAKNMIDFISLTDIEGVAYPEVTKAAGSIDFRTIRATFGGGSDGDLFSTDIVYDQKTQPVLDINGDPVVVNGVAQTESVDDTTKPLGTKGNLIKEELLNKFYRGEIDANIFDARIIDAGITYDAWFPQSVKDTMGGYFGTEVREDIAVVLDLGEEVDELSKVQPVANGLSISHPHGGVAVNIHNGVTRDRERNIRTTGNYELAYALPVLYKNRGRFAIQAGFKGGRVTTMDFDFTPRVVKDNTEIKPLRTAKLLFAMRLNRDPDVYYMSDSSQYAPDNSVLNSFRNIVFAGEVIRTFRKVLIKYSFSESADVAIAEATDELNKIFQGQYFPAGIPVTFNIFQTRNDKINKNASVTVGIDFPDVIETWTVTISANRKPLE